MIVTEDFVVILSILCQILKLLIQKLAKVGMDLYLLFIMNGSSTQLRR